jgi:hypothetical protein
MKTYKFKSGNGDDDIIAEMEGESLLDAAQKMRLEGIAFFKKRKHEKERYRRSLAKLVLQTAQQFADEHHVPD